MLVKIIYWSGTGNTEKMAEAVREGVSEGGAEAEVVRVSEAKAAEAVDADVLALGCPPMGDEVLEETEMEPFVSELEKQEGAKNKRLVLFGSYGWGDKRWMREWQARMIKAGFKIIENSVVLQGEPDAGGLEACRRLGLSVSKLEA